METPGIDILQDGKGVVVVIMSGKRSMTAGHPLPLRHEDRPCRIVVTADLLPVPGSGDGTQEKATLDSDLRVFRPANYSPQCPGRGHGVIERKGKKLGILNLEGQVFMPPIDSPFSCADVLIDEMKNQYGENLPVIVDFHAEATSEKQAMGYFLDGKVSAVLGTHTHVQTADAKILRHGTAYISDVGMTGGQNGILGVKCESVMQKFLTGMPVKFEASEEDPAFNGVILEIDEITGLALNIQAIQVPVEI